MILALDVNYQCIIKECYDKNNNKIWILKEYTYQVYAFLYLSLMDWWLLLHRNIKQVAIPNLFPCLRIMGDFWKVWHHKKPPKLLSVRSCGLVTFLLWYKTFNKINLLVKNLSYSEVFQGFPSMGHIEKCPLLQLVVKYVLTVDTCKTYQVQLYEVPKNKLLLYQNNSNNNLQQHLGFFVKLCFLVLRHNISKRI